MQKTKKPNFRGIAQAKLINVKNSLRDRKIYDLADTIQATLDVVAKI